MVQDISFTLLLKYNIEKIMIVTYNNSKSMEHRDPPSNIPL